MIRKNLRKSAQIRCVAAAVGVVILATTICTAQTAAAKLAARSGSISGRITMNGKGLAGITVTLRSGGFGGSQTDNVPQAKSDGDGKYKITGVPIGSWFVTPVAPAYTVPGANRITTANDAVVITGADTVDGIDFALVKGGIITGKVADAASHPVIEQSISIQNTDTTNQQGGRPQQGPIGSFRTDDRGVYRIYGIPAGHYIVSVGAAQRLSSYATIQGQVAYKQTFHPDVTDSSQATAVEVTEGAEIPNVDITVGGTVDEYSVTGRVIDQNTGVPLPNVGFTLSILAGGGNRQRAMGFTDLPVVSDSNGVFRVDNVAPGKYIIGVSPQNSNGMTGQSAAFDVINQDVKDVEVRALNGATISGFVALDGNFDQTIQAELMQFQVQAFVQGNGGAGAASAQTIPLNADGSFQITGLSAGNVRLGLTAEDQSLQGAFKVTRIELNNVPQQRGITVNSGDQITGVKVVTAYADGIVSGRVTFQNGALTPDMRVFARLSSTGQTRGFGGGANVDPRGNFIIENVPPGSYTVIVQAMGPGRRRGGGGAQPQAPATAQQPLVVTEGQIANASLVLDLGQNAPPQAPPAAPAP